MKLRPIEDAPKTHKEIVIYFESADCVFVRNCSWIYLADSPENEPSDEGWWFYENSVARTMPPDYWRILGWHEMPEVPRL